MRFLKSSVVAVSEARGASSGALRIQGIRAPRSETNNCHHNRGCQLYKYECSSSYSDPGPGRVEFVPSIPDLWRSLKGHFVRPGFCKCSIQRSGLYINIAWAKERLAAYEDNLPILLISQYIAVISGSIKPSRKVAGLGKRRNLVSTSRRRRASFGAHLTPATRRPCS